MTDIEVLGEIRCRYNLFDAKEQRYYEALSNAIQALSSAVEVVRCLECKWFAEGKWCRNPNNDMVQGGTTGEWYCADGERKGGDE